MGFLVLLGESISCHGSSLLQLLLFHACTHMNCKCMKEGDRSRKKKCGEGKGTVLCESVANYLAGLLFKIKDEVHNSQTTYKPEYVS